LPALPLAFCASLILCRASSLGRVPRRALRIALVDLEYLGPTGHDAYAQMTAAEHFTPHSRTDVAWGGV
jgi:hypothetical protein